MRTPACALKASDQIAQRVACLYSPGGVDVASLPHPVAAPQVLGLRGVPTAGVVERQELVALCLQAIAVAPAALALTAVPVCLSARPLRRAALCCPPEVPIGRGGRRRRGARCRACPRARSSRCWCGNEPVPVLVLMAGRGGESSHNLCLHEEDFMQTFFKSQNRKYACVFFRGGAGRRSMRSVGRAENTQSNAIAEPRSRPGPIVR
jgi:hypothetical protein